VLVDRDALAFEQRALGRCTHRIEDGDAAEAAALADHALPRHRAAADLHRRRGHARAPGDAGQLRELTVGDHPAARHPARDVEDAAVQRGNPGARRWPVVVVASSGL
jgi:hypothetical protein